MGEARWWADEVIGRMEGFRDEGTLLSGDEVQLARAYLYGAVIYITIADMFDDFAFSNRQEPAPPVGPENMGSLYDTAVQYIDNALAISGISDDLKAALTGLRARANYSKALWGKLNPSVDTANPLVDNAAAVSDAQAALVLMADIGSDYKFQLEMSPSAPDLVVGDLSLGLQVNSRLEMRIADPYIIPDTADGEGKKVANLDDGNPATSISLNDPVDDIPDPVIYDEVLSFTNAIQYPDMTIVSEREMYLILAEAALAGNSSLDFEEQINNLRDLNSELSDYTGQISQLDMLKHSRRVSLFLQGRRIADHYRFDDPSFQWQSNSDAMSNPGTFFPITIIERRANPHIN